MIHPTARSNRRPTPSQLPRHRLTLIFALTCLIAVGTPSRASQSGWPALYDVYDVDVSDVLNVRAGPNAGSEIIGALPHDATGVEVLRANEEETWGMVNVGERTGWVSLRFLTRQTGYLDGMFPDFTACFGTEPFWSLARANGTLTLDLAFDEQPALAEIVEWETTSPNHRGRYSFSTPNMTGFVARQACSDGMSDREFGLEINLILRRDATHLQGCCSILPREE